MTRCTRSNSPSRDESSNRARGLKRTLMPCSMRSDPALRRFVLLPWTENSHRTFTVMHLKTLSSEVTYIAFKVRQL